MAEWLHHLRVDFEPRATDAQVDDLWERLTEMTRRWSARTGVATLVTAVDEKRIEGRP